MTHPSEEQQPQTHLFPWTVPALVSVDAGLDAAKRPVVVTMVCAEVATSVVRGAVVRKDVVPGVVQRKDFEVFGYRQVA